MVALGLALGCGRATFFFQERTGWLLIGADNALVVLNIRCRLPVRGGFARLGGWGGRACGSQQSRQYKQCRFQGLTPVRIIMYRCVKEASMPAADWLSQDYDATTVMRVALLFEPEAKRFVRVADPWCFARN